MRNAEKSDTSRPVSTPGIHKVAPLFGGKPHRGRGGMDRNRGRGRGKQIIRSIEKQDAGVDESDTLYVFSVNPSAFVMLINIEEKPMSILDETIRESIDKCRFTVLVLSPDFLSSNCCLLEMHLARSRIISQGRDVIVPIILHEFPTSQVTRTLEGILSKSCLQWTDDPEGQTRFWDKLITKLKRGGNLRPLEN